jgi:SAM-dependent methyltransferase
MSGLAVSAKLKENYASYYEGESSWRALGAVDKVDNVLDLCSTVPHRRILDIGSGEGSVLKRLSDLRFGEDLYSVEISASAVTTIRRRNIVRVRECQLFDGYGIPYKDRQFDLAVLSHVLEHAEYPRKLLHEASRVADYLFIEVPLEDTIRLKPDFVFDQVGHINFYSWKTIRRLVQTCDLQIVSQKVTNPSRAVYEYCSGRKGAVKYAIKELLLQASERLASGLFTYHCAILCSRTCD